MCKIYGVVWFHLDHIHSGTGFSVYWVYMGVVPAWSSMSENLLCQVGEPNESTVQANGNITFRNSHKFI